VLKISQLSPQVLFSMIGKIEKKFFR